MHRKIISLILLLSIITLKNISCQSLKNDSEIEYYSKNLIKKIKTNSTKIKTKINNKVYIIMPNTEISVNYDQSYILEEGIIFEYNYKRKNNEFHNKLFGEPKWGGVSLFSIVTNIKEDIKFNVNLVYQLEKGNYELNTISQPLNNENETKEYAFFIPYSLYHKSEKIDITIELLDNKNIRFGMIKKSYPIEKREWKTQTIRFSKGKSNEIKNADRNKYEKERKKRFDIWNENNSYNYFLSGFSYPLEDYSYLTSEFGLRREWRLSNGKLHSTDTHLGVDYAQLKGTPVFATSDGVVRYSESAEYLGNAIILDHGLSLYSVYMHLDELLVTENQFVKKGELIGKVGMTGASTGPHLHWEMRVNSIPVDPRTLFFINDFL